MGNIEQSKISERRRKLLKTSGVVGGAAAVGAWSKPMLDSVMTPAHAEMSVPVVLDGSSSSSSTPITGNDNSLLNSIAEKFSNALVSDAHAGVTPSLNEISDFFYDSDSGNFSHCISVSLPSGEDPEGNIDIQLNSPDIWYQSDGSCYYSGYYYFDSLVNFSGSASGSLANRDFSIPVGDIRIVGTVSSDYSQAAGVLYYTGSGQNAGRFNTIYSGYGAYWEADLSGGTCTAGEGFTESDYAYGNCPISTD